MKSSILILLFFTFSLGSFAQHDFNLKPMPKISFNSGQLATDSTNITFKPNQFYFDLDQYFPKKQDAKIRRYKQYNQSNMPIAGLGHYQTNMPILVPDSSINYAIRIKRIGTYPTPNK